MKKIFLSAFAVIGMSMAANAQNASATATQSVSLTLANGISLTFTGSGTSTGGAVTLPFSTVSDYANGVTSTAQQLEVQSNLDFDVAVKANATNFTYAGTYTTGTTMPVSGVLKLKKSTASSYITLSTSDQTFTTGPLGPNTVSGNTFNIARQFTPGWSYAGGTYRLNVIYTASQQ